MIIRKFSLFFIVFFFVNNVVANDSSIFINWSQNIANPHQVRQFTVDYTPSIGYPPSHSVFPASKLSLAINSTLPATEYLINVSALLTDGRRVPILSTVITSSPPKPILEFLKAQEYEVTFAFLAPKIPDLTYYIEYFDVNREKNVNFIETNKTALRIHQLKPNTRYGLRVYAVYRGVPCVDSLETEFKTRELLESFTTPFTLQKTAIDTNKISSKFTDSTQLSQSTIHRKPVRPFSVEMPVNYVTVTMMPLAVSQTPEKPYYTSENEQLLPHWKQPEKFNTSHSHLSELPPLEVIGELAASFLNYSSTTQSPTLNPFTVIEDYPTTHSKQPMQIMQVSEPIKLESVQPLPQNSQTLATKIVNLSKSLKTTTTQESPKSETIPNERIVEEIDVNEMPTITENPIDFTEPIEHQSSSQKNEDETTTVLVVDDKTNKTEELLNFENDLQSQGNESDSFIESRNEIRVSKEGNEIRLEWDAPEKALCDNYLVNTTLLDSGESLSTASGNEYSYIKFYDGERISVTISCMLEGAISTVWSAEKFLDLNKPKPVENLRIKDTFTDEFYVASVTLDINWPLKYNTDLYEIVVVWALGKKAIGNNKSEFNERGEMIIGKLEAAKMYTFAVRNVSKELGIASAPMGIRQITPPVITSTVYPGQISSYAININFGDSEREYPFDNYELIFAGNAKNITKKLSKSDSKSFTFNKLIPGKTYAFVLYTVYKNVRSRPVVEEITTYPLKVKSFNPIVGPGYVTLFWEIENVADNHCKFRLEYASTSNSGIRKSQRVNLKDTNHYRFSGLEYDTYYTFTITVLMGKGKAEAESESEMVTIGFNERPTSLPILKRHGSRELQLMFENDPRIFSDTNGIVDNFAIIVSEDIKLGGDDFELKSYYEIRDETQWPAYRASHSTYNPFKKRGSSRSATFLIGEEDCDKRKLNEPFCNGVLKSHVDYYVKVRAYLVSNFAMETEWVSVGGLVDENPEKGHRRLPCFMYLNGCSSYSNPSTIPSKISICIAFISLLSYYLFVR